MTGKEIRAKINKEYEDVAKAKLPVPIAPEHCPMCGEKSLLVYRKERPIRLWEGEPKAYAEGWNCPVCRANGYKITHHKGKVKKFITHIADTATLGKAKLAKSIAMLEVILGKPIGNMSEMLAFAEGLKRKGCEQCPKKSTCPKYAKKNSEWGV